VLDALLATARAHSVSAPRSCDARAVAEHAAQSVHSVAAERGVSVEVQRSGLSARVAAETDLLERALTPIIENAIRFARRRVDIAIRVDTTHVIFEVKDDGPGVDPTLRERIFEPGVSQGGNGAASGAGLGLPLARRLVHAAEGEIDCVPTDQGAIFALRLPAG
jgi:signal transduction histidine kinase